ncbi:MAG: hypothetical protein A2190_00905 [Lysobacterales bacterium RIFOXYA1_FULL_69_10]|nr:MAG: hypothetical protein A2190_00905 [Xanthomonadales bacterium RIFOXYA1_FULL_69_10]
MTPQQTNDDRETLSALFDGELRGDAARFAFKRLDHDSAWGQAVGRWQLAGDVLRGRAEASAPADFAQRVSAALADEAGVDAAPAVASGTGSSRRALGGWMPGAALAASVAVAAFLVARPLENPAGPAETAPPVVVAAAAPAEVRAPQLADTATDAGAAPAAALAGAAVVAAAERPRRSAQRQLAAAAARDTTAPETAGLDDAVPATEGRDVQQVAAVQVADEPQADPFQPRAAEFGARPWPRAVLTDYRAGGAMTASYGTSASASAPSFYPFVPRTDDDVRQVAPTPADTGEADTPAPTPPSP